MYRIHLLPLLILALPGPSGCQHNRWPSTGEIAGLADSSERRGKLVVTGSSTVAPLVAEVARRFEELHPHARIEVQTGGSSRGIREAKNGSTDVGMSSRALKANERSGLVTHTVAWDGVAFAIHRDNRISELNKEQLVGIYTGTFDNWKDVGGPDAPIVVSNRAEGRSELKLMSEFLQLEPTQIRADMVDSETQQTIKTVCSNVNAIIYTSIGAAQHAIEHGAPLKLLPLNGVPASTASIESNAFPLARPLILIQPTERPNDLADAFVSFALSPAVDDLTESLGYVPPQRDQPQGSR